MVRTLKFAAIWTLSVRIDPERVMGAAHIALGLRNLVLWNSHISRLLSTVLGYPSGGDRYSILPLPATRSFVSDINLLA